MTTITSHFSTINLDANASVPALPMAKKALIDALEMQGNASSPHALGRQLRVQLDRAREHVAAALGGYDKELFFCSGASEGNRWLVDALVHSGEMRGRPYKVLLSPLEHPSLMKSVQAKADLGKLIVEKMSLKDGALCFETEALGRSEVIFLTASHNETGYLPDFDALTQRLSDQTILISDATQSVGRSPPLPRRVDAIVCSSHKMGGVVGAGAVLIRGRARTLSAPWSGGGQEAGLRPGSESVPLIAAMGCAAENIEAFRNANQALFGLRNAVECELLRAWPFAFAIGNAGARLPQTVALCLDGLDADALRIAIDQVGVCVGFGSACSALAPEPSPALLAFGLTPKQARTTIRISLSPSISEETVWMGVERLKKAVAHLVSTSRFAIR